MIVCNELLGRPLLKIYQDPDYFSFSLDSMLLASFATIGYRTNKIVDLCSGNAPIPLYLSLRTEMINDNLKDINKKIGFNEYDLVTCNPPYFKVGSHNINPKDSKAIARHEILATLEDIIIEASNLLKSKGRFAMVHRPDRLIEILELMKKYRIYPKRLRLVYPKINSECNNILIEGIKDGNENGLRILSPLYVYNNDNKWTNEVVKIYNFEEE